MNSRRPLAIRVASVIVSAAVIAAACTTPVDLTPLASISLQPSFDSVELGTTYSGWTLTLKDVNNTTVSGRKLTWESNNLAVATIDASTGVLTAVGSGQSNITVRAEGLSAQSTIKVLQPVMSIVATPDSFDLPMTTTRTISVQLVGPNGVALTNRAITWRSNNPAVAVVSTTGLVTPVAPGNTTITVFAGGKEVTVRVRVVGEPVTSVRISPQQTVHVIRLGQSRQLSAECFSASQQVLAGRPITWNSSNPVVASVSQTGLVSGNALGNATITATCDNTASASVTAQVTPVPVSSVTVTPTSMSLAAGTLGQLIATARDSAGNVLSLQGRSVQWLTDNQPVAAVSTTGVVSANSPGGANIQAVVDGVASPQVPVLVTSSFAILGRPGSRLAPVAVPAATGDPRN